jgi:flagellar motor protein MotB
MFNISILITFIAEVLFDSGKDKILVQAEETLGKISPVLKTTVKDLSIGVEGHTDNVPIKFSGWKSNWELSTARALSVLHYLIDLQGIEPQRLSATGHGEYRPVESNDTFEGRKKNRRVEIVILPRMIKSQAAAAPEPEPEDGKIIIRKNSQQTSSQNTLSNPLGGEGLKTIE